MIESSKKDITKDRIISPQEKLVDQNGFSNLLRPLSLDEYVGQESIKKHLSVAIASSKIR
jgi:Holliday junction resolvasome RuvABC ATP-dependent DNA helicase subunit